MVSDEGENDDEDDENLQGPKLGKMVGQGPRYSEEDLLLIHYMEHNKNQESRSITM